MGFEPAFDSQHEFRTCVLLEFCFLQPAFDMQPYSLLHPNFVILFWSLQHPEAMIWWMRHTNASDPAWDSCGTTVGWQKLGPVGSLRLSILWFTGHNEEFYLTEAPMIAKKWGLQDMTSDGMLLEPRGKKLSGNKVGDRLLVRPNEAAPIVNVEIGSVMNDKVNVMCSSLAGTMLMEEEMPYGSTWFDVTAMLAFPLSKKMYNVKLTSGGKYIGRSFFHHDLTQPVPNEKLELDFMKVDVFASSSWEVAVEKKKKTSESNASSSKVSVKKVGLKQKLFKKPS